MAAEYPSVEVHRRTAEGPPRKVLLEASATADLLVVGARRKQQTFGLQLGRVAHTVLHHCACPVAVVPRRSCDGAAAVPGADGPGSDGMVLTVKG